MFYARIHHFCSNRSEFQWLIDYNHANLLFFIFINPTPNISNFTALVTHLKAVQLQKNKHSQQLLYKTFLRLGEVSEILGVQIISAKGRNKLCRIFLNTERNKFLVLSPHPPPFPLFFFPVKEWDKRLASALKWLLAPMLYTTIFVAVLFPLFSSLFPFLIYIGSSLSPSEFSQVFKWDQSFDNNLSLYSLVKKISN